MLVFDSSALTIEGITIFRDHAEKTQFWYLPGPVSLARRASDNRPSLTFMKYKRAAGTANRGGGFLTFEVALRLDSDLERRITERLASISHGQPRLSVVPFDDGTVQCIALNVQGAGGTHATVDANAPAGSFRAVETILGASKPSLQGDNVAAFSLELSAEGATILETSFKDRATPIGVIYDLKYTGLRPAFNVKITADFKQVFTHFSSSANGQRGFVRAGIDAGFEKLTRSGAIKIEVLDFTNTAENEARVKDALDFFKTQVLTNWFTPVLVPGTLNATAAQASTLEEVRAMGAQLKPPQPPAPPKPDPSQSAADPVNNGPSPTEGTGKGDAGTGVAAAEADSNAKSPTEGSGSPAVASPAPASGTADVAVRNPNGGLAASADKPDPSKEGAVSAFKLKMIKQEEQRTVSFEYSRAEAMQRSYAPQGFFGLLTADLAKSKHFFEIDLDDPFYRTIPIEVKAPFDFAGIGLSEIQVSLDYGPKSDLQNFKHADITFSASDRGPKPAEFAVNLRKDNKFSVTTQFHFDPASGWEGKNFSYELPPKVTDDRTLIMHPMEALGFLDVKIERGRIDADAVDFIDVELKYADTSPWNTRKVFRIKPDSESASWKLRLSQPGQREYSYQFTHHMKDGTIKQGALIRTQATSVLVDDPFPGSLDVTFFPFLDWTELRAAMLDVTYVDQANSFHREKKIRLAENTTETNVRFSIVDPAQKTYRHQLTLVHQNGTTERKPAVETDVDIVSLTA